QQRLAGPCCSCDRVKKRVKAVRVKRFLKIHNTKQQTTHHTRDITFHPQRVRTISLKIRTMGSRYLVGVENYKARLIAQIWFRDCTVAGQVTYRVLDRLFTFANTYSQGLMDKD